MAPGAGGGSELWEQDHGSRSPLPGMKSCLPLLIGALETCPMLGTSWSCPQAWADAGGRGGGAELPFPRAPPGTSSLCFRDFLSQHRIFAFSSPYRFFSIK